MLSSQHYFLKDRPDMYSAKITRGTVVDMVEYDFGFLRRGSPWDDMARKWLQEGAHVRMFCAGLAQQAREAVAEIALKYPGLNVLDYSGASGHAKKFADSARTYHFTLFSLPRQMWLEGDHPVDSDIVFQWEWVPEDRCNDLRYDMFSGVVDVLKDNSRPVFAIPSGHELRKN